RRKKEDFLQICCFWTLTVYILWRKNRKASISIIWEKRIIWLRRSFSIKKQNWGPGQTFTRCVQYFMKYLPGKNCQRTENWKGTGNWYPLIPGSCSMKKREQQKS